MTTSANYITLNQLGTEILEEFPDTKFFSIYFEENKIWKGSYNSYNFKPIFFSRVENNDNNIILSHDEILQGNLITKNLIITIPKSLNKFLNPKNNFISCIFVDLRKTNEYNGHKYYKCTPKRIRGDIEKQIREQITDEKEDEDEDEDLDIDAIVNNIIPGQPKPEVEEVEEQTEPEVKETKKGRKPRK